MKKQSTLRWIWQVSKKQFIIIGLLAVVSGLISFSFVWFALLSKQVIDIATGVITGNMWLESGKLLGVLVLQAALNIVYKNLFVYASGQIEMHIKQTVFEKLFNKQWHAYSAYHSGDILNRLTSDVSVVIGGAVSLIPQCVSLITRLIACLAVMVMIDPMFTAILLAAGLLVMVLSRFYGKKMKAVHRECQQTDGQTRSFIQECLENWAVIQSFGVIHPIRDRLNGLQQINFKKKVYRNRISNLANTAVYLLFSGFYYIALAWGAWRLASGMISFGTLTAFLQIVQQVKTPFQNMSGILPQYYNMMASAERLIELEQLPDEARAQDPFDAEQVYSGMSAISIQNLSFSYDHEKVLHNANMVIEKGAFIVLSGRSGIGKSTLFKLLLGFLEPTEGQITLQINNEPITVSAVTRPLFAYVPQGNLILSGTIRQNIAFCQEEASDDDIWQAAKIASISSFIQSLPDGLDTTLGERGLGLSEGQIQRLAIARGVLSGSPILLLDEVTSALDEETEKEILNNLKNLSNKTCLCITHRPAALNICDYSIEIRDGQFVRIDCGC